MSTVIVSLLLTTTIQVGAEFLHPLMSFAVGVAPPGGESCNFALQKGVGASSKCSQRHRFSKDRHWHFIDSEACDIVFPYQWRVLAHWTCGHYNLPFSSCLKKSAVTNRLNAVCAPFSKARILWTSFMMGLGKFSVCLMWPEVDPWHLVSTNQNMSSSL